MSWVFSYNGVKEDFRPPSFRVLLDEDAPLKGKKQQQLSNPNESNILFPLCLIAG